MTSIQEAGGRVNAGHVTILMSGGIDSAATVAACRGLYASKSGLFVDYGQPAGRSEWEAVLRIAQHFSLDTARLDVGLKMSSRQGEYFGRNALLLLAAASSSEVRPLSIALGIHSMCPYYDTTPLFVRDMQRLLDGYSGGEIGLTAPFLSHTKAEVIRYAKNVGIPLELTYSCEVQDAPPCGQCPSCRDRREFETD